MEWGRVVGVCTVLQKNDRQYRVKRFVICILSLLADSKSFQQPSILWDIFLHLHLLPTPSPTQWDISELYVTQAHCAVNLRWLASQGII